MRLHQLQVQAFGPFAGVESVNFDELDAVGLYLIHGATGAGKTSILDAVCYAVYGAVPGSRTGHRETIRSDHADLTVQPYAVIEFTAAGERLRIRRSPEWAAPKKRGSGTTRRPATVSLEVLRGSDWVVQSTRMDEVAEIVTDHLGLGLEQFAQVVLLPQGEFATFLRAKPEDRATLLSRLFDIGRFTDAQSWLTERKRALASSVLGADGAVGHQADRLAALLTELDPSTGPDLSTDPVATDPACTTPESADSAPAAGPDPVRHRDPEQLLMTIDWYVEAAAAHATQALVEADAAARNRDLTRDAWQQGGRLVQLQQQAGEAREVCDAYTAAAPARQASAQVLRAAQRAAVVEPVSSRRDAAAGDLAAAGNCLDAAIDAVDALIGPHRRLESCSDLTVVSDAISSGGEALAALPDLTVQHATTTQTVRRLEEQMHLLSHRRASVRERLGELNAVTDRINAELDALPADPDVFSDAERHVDAAREALRTGESLLAAAASLQEVHGHAVEVRAVYASAEGRVIELRRRRLAGIVGELGTDLQEGCPCPVCGSSEHPVRAALSDDAASAEDVTAAEADAECARSRHVESEARVAAAHDRRDERTVAHRLSLASLVHWTESAAKTSDSQSGPGSDGVGANAGVLQVEVPDLDVLGEALDRALEILACRIARREHRTELTRRRELAASSLATAQTDDVAAEMEAAATAARLRDAADRRTEVRDQMVGLRERHTAVCWCDSVDSQEPLSRHALLEDAYARLRRADDARRVAHDVDRGAGSDLSRMLVAQEFLNAEQASAALLQGAQIERIEEALGAERAAYDRALGVLSQPQVADAVHEVSPDVHALEHAAYEADHRRMSTAQAVSAADRAVRDLRDIDAAVRQIVADSAQDRAELAVLGPLADTASGHGDNVLRMRLTSYVLAARLEMVTALANDHLHVMSDGRFSLEHSDELARRGARSGLGLRVLDAWTGRARDTASLSGGEGFIASLALALGLGDAVLHDTGGRPLETLFVDEGFGSLDEQTLDQVMEVLDGLRAGGRSVGIVSHVAELRQRITGRVEVIKTETGSHIAVHAAQRSAVA